MAEPTATTAAVTSVVGTSALLSLLLGPTHAQLVLIILGSILGASTGAIARSSRGWRALGVMLLAALLGLFFSAFDIPYLEGVHKALVAFCVAAFTTAPIAHAKSMLAIAINLSNGIAAFKRGFLGQHSDNQQEDK